MGAADEQIRVSDRVKTALDRHRREDESYNDVLERLLEEAPATDFYDGLGLLSEAEAERLREQRDAAEDVRKERARRLENA